MDTVGVEFLDRTSCGSDVITCRFEKPVGYRFVPGQFLMLGVDTGEEYVRKPLTIASAPDDAWLEITTRTSASEFKIALGALVPGDGVEVSVAKGKLVVPRDSGPLGFLAGGVGITPARSILRSAAQSGDNFDAVLFYGNRDATCIPYEQELGAMASSGIRTVHVLQFPPDGWEGESGFITAHLVSHTAPTARDRLWVVSGPPAMVNAMTLVLDELAVPDDRRLIERFAGYA